MEGDLSSSHCTGVDWQKQTYIFVATFGHGF